MAVWIIRAGRMGENEEFALNECVYSIGFSQERSVADFSDYESLRDYIHRQSDEWSLQQASSRASQLWRFVHDMQIGEMIVLPRKRHRVIAVGRITGNYVYNADESQAPLPHTRKVEWLIDDVPRANFDQDLKHSFTSQLTVSQVRKDNAETRILQVVNAYLGDEQMTEPIPHVSSSEDLDDEAVEVNLEETINDRILERIRQRYHGHELETLVDEILKSEGYATLKTEAGPDGGADILAGSGALGFDSPKLCVQVKSGATNVGIGDYDRLQGTLDAFNADYGLLVSSTGFTQVVIRENRRRFFKIRLWGPDELVQKLLETYDRLPQSIRANIPLENRLVWMGSDE
ncbi:MAG: restriction endonuclease [Chloroflexi bacterium]|nr:restriction endonuclease [Chloroflexota bacterium]